jgi:ABC-type transport system involved in Fe-S cluster assembly fused permease/ATPase subunit
MLQTPGIKPRIIAGRGNFITTLRELWPYIWPSERPDLKLRVALALLALLATKIVTILVPYTFKWATDALTAMAEGRQVETGDWLGWVLGAPVALVLAYGFGRVVMMLLTQVRDGLFAAVALYAVRKLAQQTFEHIHHLSLRFHLERRTGALSRIVQRGRDGIETLVRLSMLTIVPTIVELVLVFGVLALQFDFRYMVVVAAMVAAYTWFTFVASDRRLVIRRVMNESDQDANAKALDSLLNYETVKYFNNEGLESTRYDRAMAGYEGATIKTYTSLAWLNAGQAAIFTVGLTLVMALAALDTMAGRSTVGDFVLVNAMLIQLNQPLNFLGMVYREFKESVTDIEAMFELIAKNPEVADRLGAYPLAVNEGRIVFDDVRFSYDPARPILKGISFEVPAGRTVAIVGPSGAGKSTISRLLYRFYDVSGGRILIDGHDIRDVTQASLRRAIGMVPQDTVLFNDTIAYNIEYGRPGAGQLEVREAARLAQIDGFIQTLPQGYETPVGERGLKLSGGEKQRVAIARTILKGPPILILDEATSALDTHTEQEIQAALDRVSANRTTLVIAHRLSTVIHADEIIVLKAGQIVERGRHEELLSKSGLYADMWNRQREAEEARERLKRATEGADSDLTRDQIPAE